MTRLTEAGQEDRTMYQRVRIAQHQIGLRFRGADLIDVLLPGKHWVRSALWGAERDA